ncbi:ABC transporter permease [Desulfofundulus thermosubterraneus]|uniref:Peptide/nickel transport system permease protein n=1 Tax=Desulfofundulus thermosubterraneus DSM 16057 TaxID=1121432 RepID=A0A1M6GQR2_9FIRM|nr:ABC transporter permease [Desulfofundulus thermosubterraneus]SHJ12285.1 peptide/nickel transport system permease protein [Desulfofundulus thermosubterraneus DSM 16057]
MKTTKVVQRLFESIPLFVLTIIAVFFLVRIMPGDPVDIMMGSAGNVSQEQIEQMRSQLGLDKPIAVQFADFVRGAAHGDLGYSITQSKKVTDLLVETFPATIELALAAFLFAILIGLPVGIFSAVKQNSWVDRLDPTLELQKITGLFLLDSILTGNWAAFRSAFTHLILPAVTLGAELLAIVARISRSSMVEVLRHDYVQLACSKGLKETAVIFKHALPNALIPTVTVVGLQMGVLLGGNMIVETVFGWPGLGRLVVQSIFARDYTVIQGAVMLYGVTFILANLLVDIVYTYLNPKISL